MHTTRRGRDALRRQEAARARGSPRSRRTTGGARTSSRRRRATRLADHEHSTPSARTTAGSSSCTCTPCRTPRAPLAGEPDDSYPAPARVAASCSSTTSATSSACTTCSRTTIRDPAAFDRAAGDGRRARELPRDAVADVLARAEPPLRRGRGGPRNVDRLRDSDAVAVVTGQQPALFGGPLYNLLQGAPTAIAPRAGARGADGRPHVPVFWIANDDHSAQRGRPHLRAPRDGEPRADLVGARAAEDRAADRRRPAGRRLVAGARPALAVSAAGSVSGTFSSCSRTASVPGERLSDSFARLLATLFDRTGSSSSIRASRAAAPRHAALAPELDFPSPTTEAAPWRPPSSRARGYPVQVPLRDDRLEPLLRPPSGSVSACGPDGFQIEPHDRPSIDA